MWRGGLEDEGDYKAIPPPLASQQLPANHRLHSMKREVKGEKEGKGERQGGQRKGGIKERKEELRVEGERERKMVRVEATTGWTTTREDRAEAGESF